MENGRILFDSVCNDATEFNDILEGCEITLNVAHQLCDLLPSVHTRCKKEKTYAWFNPGNYSEVNLIIEIDNIVFDQPDWHHVISDNFQVLRKERSIEKVDRLSQLIDQG